MARHHNAAHSLLMLAARNRAIHQREFWKIGTGASNLINSCSGHLFMQVFMTADPVKEPHDKPVSIETFNPEWREHCKELHPEWEVRLCIICAWKGIRLLSNQ